MKRIIKEMLLSAAIIAGVFGFDRWTKVFADAHIPENGMSLIGHLLGLMHHHNFGLLANAPVPQWIIITFTSIVILALCVLLARTIRRSSDDAAIRIFPLSILIGGALGNLFDRVTQRFVFDWILLFNRSVINVADVAIAVGIVWFLFLTRKKETPEHVS